jgi:3-hydroxyisobutyrate dehydrogenase-like beta-hydroxyacid dehydrogenase
MNVGFIGVGNIGAPIAGQLLKAGHTLVVHDLRREAANALLEVGVEWSDSPAALAAGCDVVMTCLPGPVEMEQVCLGPGGIVGHLKPGTLYIDHTTNLPALVQRVHEMLAARDVATCRRSLGRPALRDLLQPLERPLRSSFGSKRLLPCDPRLRRQRRAGPRSNS